VVRLLAPGNVHRGSAAAKNSLHEIARLEGSSWPSGQRTE
jgi:hypothetical protein